MRFRLVKQMPRKWNLPHKYSNVAENPQHQNSCNLLWVDPSFIPGQTPLNESTETTGNLLINFREGKQNQTKENKDFLETEFVWSRTKGRG